MELALDLNRRYTYADYLKWFDDVRRELVDGLIKLMSAPRPRHQAVSCDMAGEFRNIIKRHKGKCRVYPAPFDVRLPVNGERAHNEIYTVVQPDLCIICDRQKIDRLGCCGAPDFIAEILSQSTSVYDSTTKLHLYERSGVREYWIVAPDEFVDVYLLQDDGKYAEPVRYVEGKIPVQTLGNEEVDIEDIFAE
jgi:Uma2 family endonuclease